MQFCGTLQLNTETADGHSKRRQKMEQERIRVQVEGQKMVTLIDRDKATICLIAPSTLIHTAWHTDEEKLVTALSECWVGLSVRADSGTWLLGSAQVCGNAKLALDEDLETTDGEVLEKGTVVTLDRKASNDSIRWNCVSAYGGCRFFDTSEEAEQFVRDHFRTVLQTEDGKHHTLKRSPIGGMKDRYGLVEVRILSDPQDLTFRNKLYSC